MNIINKKKIVTSIEMKDKWLGSILKESRKLSSLDKFWNLVIEELGVFCFDNINHRHFFISSAFLEALKEADLDRDIDKHYELYAPGTYEEIDSEDYSIYITEGYKK